MFPLRVCTFYQFVKDCGVEDTFLEAMQLGSPSGHWSKRSEKSLKDRLAAKQAKWFAAGSAYEFFLDCGLMADPSGAFLNGPSRLARNLIQEADSLERGADRLETFASLHPRSYPKKAAELRRQAAALRAQIDPKAIV